MKDVMGIIINNQREDILAQITEARCLSAVPFGGKYRLIDFPLSNLVNSGLNNIAIVVSTNFRSLIDHIGSGQYWSLDRKKDGLVFLPQALNATKKPGGINIEDLYYNLDYLRRSRQKYVLICNSNVICNIDYRPMLDFHEKMNSKLTVMYQSEPSLLEGNYTWFVTDENNRVQGVKQGVLPSGRNKIFMGMFIIERQTLIEKLEQCKKDNIWDIMEYIEGNINQLEIFAYPFAGYVARIASVQSYHKHNLELLQPEIWKELFTSRRLIYTKSKDNPPARYLSTPIVCSGLVANGAVIEGNIENSIIFRKVKVGKDAVIKNSIIMQKCQIHNNAYLENVILDKEVTITQGAILKGPKGNPLVISKKAIV